MADRDPTDRQQPKSPAIKTSRKGGSGGFLRNYRTRLYLLGSGALPPPEPIYHADSPASRDLMKSRVARGKIISEPLIIRRADGRGRKGRKELFPHPSIRIANARRENAHRLFTAGWPDSGHQMRCAFAFDMRPAFVCVISGEISPTAKVSQFMMKELPNGSPSPSQEKPSH